MVKITDGSHSWLEREKLKLENKEGLRFTIICDKCESRDIRIVTDDSIAEGSEYTGIYGYAACVIKCVSCGNAYMVEVASR